MEHKVKLWLYFFSRKPFKSQKISRVLRTPFFLRYWHQMAIVSIATIFVLALKWGYNLMEMCIPWSRIGYYVIFLKNDFYEDWSQANNTQPAVSNRSCSACHIFYLIIFLVGLLITAELILDWTDFKQKISWKCHKREYIVAKRQRKFVILVFRCWYIQWGWIQEKVSVSA